jgi:hypothetical protein
MCEQARTLWARDQSANGVPQSLINQPPMPLGAQVLLCGILLGSAAVSLTVVYWVVKAVGYLIAMVVRYV